VDFGPAAAYRRNYIYIRIKSYHIFKYLYILTYFLMDEVSPECKILFVVVFSLRPCYAHARKCIILNQIIIYYHYHIISYVIPVYDIHMRDNGIHNSMCILFTDCLRVCVYIYIYIYIYMYIYTDVENFTARWLYICII
jgi:hypothetical protein